MWPAARRQVTAPLHGETNQFIVNPTQVSDQMPHPLEIIHNRITFVSGYEFLSIGKMVTEKNHTLPKQAIALEVIV